MAPEPGLREQKKRQTREAIAAAARELFAARGFDHVPVAEIARRAGVSEATVFNYFPTKEDLVYAEMEAFEAGLLAAVRARRPGEPVIAAFRAYLLEPRGLLGAAGPEAGETLRTISRVIAGSPALLARERQIYDSATRSLALLLADETATGRDHLAPWIVANALVGVHRSLVGYVREGILAGASTRTLRRHVRDHTERAMAVLENGLATWGARLD
jgi:AcrR family transcriptional regulator